jgi:hypothetical protein
MFSRSLERCDADMVTAVKDLVRDNPLAELKLLRLIARQQCTLAFKRKELAEVALVMLRYMLVLMCLRLLILKPLLLRVYLDSIKTSTNSSPRVSGKVVFSGKIERRREKSSI